MVQRVAGVTDTDRGLQRIIHELLYSSDNEVLVGIQEGTNTKVQSKNGRTQKSGESIAEYAAKNEFGTREIPQRSFMRSTIDEKSKTIEKVMILQVGMAIDGKISLIQAYNRIGLAVVGLIQQKIGQITTPPNSPRTIAIKKSSKPLIDFGQMIASIRHVVRKKK